MKLQLIAIVGNVGAGKTALAHALADAFPARVISSDVVRKLLFGRQPWGPHQGAQLYPAMAGAVHEAITEGRVAIIDTAGLARAFRQMLGGLREQYATVVIELRCDKSTWRLREAARTDRTNGPLGERLYDQSARPICNADISIDTSTMAPPDVCAYALQHIWAAVRYLPDRVQASA